MGQVENDARYLRQMGYTILEDIAVSEGDFQTMLDELTDAKNSLVQQNGYMPRQWVFGLIPKVPGHMLEENPDLPNLDPEGPFRRIAEMRHKSRMAAIETEANAKIRKSFIGRSSPMRGNYVPGDLVYCWRAGTGVHQAQGQWLGPARVIGIEGRNVWVSHRATAIKCAKEQLCVASPAEREMLMRIGGDDPDERSKHGVPRQQDLTQQQPPPQSPPQKQQPPPQSPPQPQKQQPRQDPRQQQFHPEPGPQVKQEAPRQEPAHQRQESRPNQEPQPTPRQKQRVRVQDDSDDDGRGKRPRVVAAGSQKMETDQEPQSDLPPVPEDDDLNATVIEVMTDIEVLLDGSSVVDVFAVNSARRKRVEVNERKMTESDRSLF